MILEEFVSSLFDVYPQAQAEDWDKPGLLVGNPQDELDGIACALDCTPRAVRSARSLGANVLLTHHPAFLEAPDLVTPSARSSSQAGATVWEAVSNGVALVAMHTNLDRSDAALDLAAEKLSMHRVGRVEDGGYGALLDAGGISLGELASRCAAAFGRDPRVYGDLDSAHDLVGFSSGSLGGIGREALDRGCTCIITGECGHHTALDLLCAGCAVILLGHDVSELPYAGLLAGTAERLAPGVPVTVLDEKTLWQTINATSGRTSA